MPQYSQLNGNMTLEQAIQKLCWKEEQEGDTPITMADD